MTKALEQGRIIARGILGSLPITDTYIQGDTRLETRLVGTYDTRDTVPSTGVLTAQQLMQRATFLQGALADAGNCPAIAHDPQSGAVTITCRSTLLTGSQN